MSDTTQNKLNSKGVWKCIFLRTCIIVACIMGINLIVYMISGSILFGLSYHGGEISVRTGFGLESMQFYPLQLADEADTVSSELRFEPISFIICLIALFLIMTLIYLSKRKRDV